MKAKDDRWRRFFEVAVAITVSIVIVTYISQKDNERLTNDRILFETREAQPGSPRIFFHREPAIEEKRIVFELVNRESAIIHSAVVIVAIVPFRSSPTVVDVPAVHIGDFAPGQIKEVSVPILGEVYRDRTLSKTSDSTMQVIVNIYSSSEASGTRVQKVLHRNVVTPMTARDFLMFSLVVAFVMGAFVAVPSVFRRVIRFSRYVRAFESGPAAVRMIPLGELASADRVLRLLRLDIGIQPARWARAVVASKSGVEERTLIFSDSINASLGDGVDDELPGVSIHRLKLPLLRLRFAQETVLITLHGEGIDSDIAARLAAKVHQAGRGPHQAVVLDLTSAQNSIDLLREMPVVSFVVVSQMRFCDLLLADRPTETLEQIIVEQIRVTDLSPYQTSGGVEQESLFFGREREIRAMADRSLRSFLLVGPRQVGKSSLLKAVERRLRHRSDVEPHYISLADHDIITQFAYHLGVDRSDVEINEMGFRDLAAGSSARPRVWLIDEADQFVAEDSRRGYNVTRIMRALSQDGLAYFVLTGYWELYAAVTYDRQHPLLNFGEVVQLGPLDREAALNFAMKPMIPLGLRWDSLDTVAQLVELTGMRANLIALACKAIIESLSAEVRVLDRERLDDTMRRGRDLMDAVRVLRSYEPLDRAIVRQSLLLCRPTDIEVRAALNELGVHVPVTAYEMAFDRLRLSGILVPDDSGGLYCPVPLIEQMIRKESSLEERLRDDVEDVQLGYANDLRRGLRS